MVLGLVTSKRAALESKDELKRRIDEAAKYVPLEQLCLSPQCGFSSTVDGNALTHRAEQFAKLRLVVETARESVGVSRTPPRPEEAVPAPFRALTNGACPPSSFVHGTGAGAEVLGAAGDGAAAARIGAYSGDPGAGRLAVAGCRAAIRR